MIHFKTIIYLVVCICWLSPAIVSAQKTSSPKVVAAKKLRKEGKLLLKLGRLDAARKKFEQAIALVHAYPIAHNELGVIAFRQKRYKAAATHFAASLKYKKDNPSALRNLGEVYRRLRRPKLALRAFYRYVVLRSSDPDGWWGLARSADKIGATPNAVQAYTQFLQLEKRDGQQKYLRYARARLKELTGKKTVKKKLPKKIKATVVAKPKKKAPKIPLKSVKIQKRRPVVQLSAAARKRLALADRLFGQRDYARAATAYRQVLANFPTESNALYRYGVCFAVSGQLQRALSVWYRVLDLRPRDSVVLGSIRRAQIKLAVQQSLKPRARFSKALYQATLVDIRKDMNRSRPASALVRVEQLIELNTSNARLYWLRGEMQLALGNFRAALRNFEMARALRPLWEFPSYAISEVHVRAGRKELAKRFLVRYKPKASLVDLTVRRRRAFERELQLKTRDF